MVRILKDIENTRFFEVAIIAGNVVTVKRYEHLNVNGGGAVERPDNGEGRDKEANYQNTQKRRRENVRNLVTTNFSKMDKFITLTFRDGLQFDICNVQECNKKYKSLILRLRRYLAKASPGTDLQYLTVIEFQDKRGRGAVHYHMLANIPYVPKAKLSKIWGYGFIRINAIEKVNHLGAYVTKYMAKDLDDERLMGQHAYMHSRNLVMPVELKNWCCTDTYALDQLHDILQGKSPSYAVTYESENAGLVQFQQFFLDK